MATIFDSRNWYVEDAVIKFAERKLDKNGNAYTCITIDRPMGDRIVSWRVNVFADIADAIASATSPKFSGGVQGGYPVAIIKDE